MTTKKKIVVANSKLLKLNAKRDDLEKQRRLVVGQMHESNTSYHKLERKDVILEEALAKINDEIYLLKSK